jgi:hypothetical protein
MKKLTIFLAILSVSIVAMAQDEEKNPNEMRTLFGNGSSNGAYGAVSIGYASIGKRDAVVLGMSGAWIMNHSFAMGVAGNAFISDFKFDENGSFKFLMQLFGFTIIT